MCGNAPTKPTAMHGFKSYSHLRRSEGLADLCIEGDVGWWCVGVRPQGTAEDCGEEKTVADLMCEQLEFADVIIINKVLEALGSARGAAAPSTHPDPTHLAK